MLFYWVGVNFQAKGRFFAANLAPGTILSYQGGDILRGLCYFVTPTHVAETMKFMPGLKALG